MVPGFGQRLEQIARHSLPALTVLVSILAESITWPVPYFAPVAPALGFSSIYYWSIYRPDLLRPSLLFLMGLLHDGIAGLPIGFSSLLFLGFSQLLVSQRRFLVGQTFMLLWAGFVFVFLLALLGEWLLLSFYNAQAIPWLPLGLQALFTVFAFPLLAWFLIRLQRGFLGQG